MVRTNRERGREGGGADSGTLLITGGTGALGRAYLSNGAWPGRIVILSRGEEKQEQLRELLPPEANVRLYIGDIRDTERLRMAFRGVTRVLHLAALKVVPGGGWNPDEMMLTNCVGTMNVLRASVEAKVDRVLVVTTDKGVLPTTFYGATKLIAEHMACVMNDWSETKISVARFGNLIGSTGSFTHRIANWKEGDPPLPITDEEMTRFWCPLSLAVKFLDFAFSKMEGGEIFVHKSPARRLLDLLPEKATWKIVGLRPTEKVHELLIGEHEHGQDFGHYVVVRPYGQGSPLSPYSSQRVSNSARQAQLDAAPPQV